MAKCPNAYTFSNSLSKSLNSSKTSKRKALEALKQDFGNWRQTRDEWVKENSLGYDSKISKVMSDAYARANSRLEKEVISVVRNGFNSGKATVAELSKQIKLKTGKAKVYAETIAVTARMMQNRSNYLEQALKAGVRKLKYVGPPAERDFCTSHLNNTYTIEEIQNMSNGQGIDVLTGCGGWRCKHSWQSVHEPILQLAKEVQSGKLEYSKTDIKQDFRDHAKDFGFETEEQYIADAKEKIKNADFILEQSSGKGQTQLVFAKNDSVVYADFDGTIRCLFYSEDLKKTLKYQGAKKNWKLITKNA